MRRDERTSTKVCFVEKQSYLPWPGALFTLDTANDATKQVSSVIFLLLTEPFPTERISYE